MDFDYDTVVAGGGPAGGQAARDLAKRGYDVLVLERDSYVGETRQSTGGTFSPTFTDFDIDPEDVSMNHTDYAVLEGPNEKMKLDLWGEVLDFGEFKKYLAEDAVENGAEYRLDRHVVDIQRETDDPSDGLEVVANVLSGEQKGEQETVRAKTVIDGTGAQAVLGRKAGLVDVDRENFGQGVEYEMEKVEMEEPGSMVLRVDPEYSPGGYAWIFDTGEDTAKVGVCGYNKYAFRHTDNVNWEDYFEKFVEEDPRLQNAEKILDEDGNPERHAGRAFFQNFDTRVDDNLILAGDTVASIDPLWGEGVYKCMKSGRLAATVTMEALDQEDFSSEQLSRYDNMWEQRVGRNRDNRLKLTHRMYRLAPDTVDTLVRELDDLEKEQMDQLRNGGSTEAVAEILKSNPSLAVNAGRDLAKHRLLDLRDTVQEFRS